MGKLLRAGAVVSVQGLTLHERQPKCALLARSI